MDKATLLTLCAQARRRAESGDLGISDQHKIISDLERHGLDATSARDILHRLVSDQEIDLAEMERLLDQMDKPKG
jgi:hypothetical protein